MSIPATNSPSGPQKPVSSDNTSPSVTNTLKGLKAEFPELAQIIKDLDQIMKASKTSVGTGFTRLFRTTSRQEVATLAAKLAKGETLTDKDVKTLTTIAATTTKKGSESAKVVLKGNDKIKQELEAQLKSIPTGALTLENLTLLKSIPQALLFTHGSAELIQKYGETLNSQDGEMNTFAKNFTKSQKTETGFTEKHNKVFKMALEHAVKTGGDPSNFMRLNPLYIKLATARFSHYHDSAKMLELSKSLIKRLKTKLSNAMTDKTVTPNQGVEIGTVVSKFFTTSIATRTLSPEYVADLKALLAEVGTHFTEKKMNPKDIALTKFQQFTSNYMLRNFAPLLSTPGPVGVYLSKITLNAANMVLFGKKEKHLPETLNPAVLTGIHSLLAMGVKNGLFTPEEVGLIKAKADGLNPENVIKPLTTQGLTKG